MVAINAKFNGRVFVPDGPVDLPLGQRVTVSTDVLPEPTAVPLPPGTPGANLMELVGSISIADLASMAASIEEGCEQPDENGE